MIDLNGIKIKNNFLIGSGPIKYGNGYNFYENPINFILFRLGLINLSHFGGAVTKTITLNPRKGNYRWYAPWQVLKKNKNSWYNRFGWNNCGIHIFRDKFYPRLKLNNLIVSIGALKSPREFIIMIDMLNKIDILAIELNLSCPHVNIKFRNNLRVLENLFLEAKRRSKHPLIIKVACLEDPVKKSILAERCGVNAISAINTIKTKLPDNKTYGRSGPEIKGTALQVVKAISSSVNIPIIGGGGIESRRDCDDFFEAGAQAVFFSSIFLTNPLMPKKIVKNFTKNH